MKQPVYLNLVLHAHLPYVRHPEYPETLAESWLFEAINECYLPLLRMLDRLARDHIDYRLTLSLSPTLLSQLDDSLLQQRFNRYIEQRIGLAEREIHRLRHLPGQQRLAFWYHNLFAANRDDYQRYQGDLVGAFAAHQQTGKLRLITTAATHGFLPLLRPETGAVANQIKIGLDSFQRRFGFASQGFWLPECGYYPDLENTLQAQGVRYFFTESHALLDAEPTPDQGIFAPLRTGNIYAFGRHPALSAAVWSAEQGYPGHPDYREYHRDIGSELTAAELQPCASADGARVNTGIKYHKVTGYEQKALYQPEKAAEQAWRDAENFVQRCRQSAAGVEVDCPALLTLPFDAELFGHWWFEGPIWLEAVLRLTSTTANELRATSSEDYLALKPAIQSGRLAASSWGEQGYNQYWLNDDTYWIYPWLRRACKDMRHLARTFTDLEPGDWRERALNQAARSLLLAQASDWPFILKAKTVPDYARQRIENHLARFNYLQESIVEHRINQEYLEALEFLDNIFPAIDFRNYALEE